MINGKDVLEHLLPEGGWVIYNDDYDSIIWDSEDYKVSKEVFEKTKNDLEKIKENEVEQIAAAKVALLEKIGLTAEEAKLILS